MAKCATYMQNKFRKNTAEYQKHWMVHEVSERVRGVCDVRPKRCLRKHQLLLTRTRCYGRVASRLPQTWKDNKKAVRFSDDFYLRGGSRACSRQPSPVGSVLRGCAPKGACLTLFSLFTRNKAEGSTTPPGGLLSRT